MIFKMIFSERVTRMREEIRQGYRRWRRSVRVGAGWGMVIACVQVMIAAVNHHDEAVAVHAVMFGVLAGVALFTVIVRGDESGGGRR